MNLTRTARGRGLAREPGCYRHDRYTVKIPVSIALVLACLAVLSEQTPASAVIVATSADDVCAPGPTLCQVTDVVEIQPGSILDFGTRPLQVTGGGQLSVGSGTATIFAGAITLSSGTPARLRVRNNGMGGSVTVVARRACSGDASLPCTSDGECSNAGAGSCDVGAGTLTIDGSIVGAADPAPIIVLRAAGAVVVNQGINASGNTSYADGGEIDIESGLDSVTINAKLEVSSGNLATGGDLTLSAGADVIVDAEINAQGGDGDGGAIDMYADGNIEIHDDVLVDATGGEGFGGDIFVDAGRDLEITGGSSSNRLLLSSRGNSLLIDNSGGDGGEQDYAAVGSIVVGEFVQFSASGAPPDGSGELICLDAGVDIVVDGDIESKARGIDGGGGDIEFYAERDIIIGASSVLDVTGGSFGGGDVDIAALDDYEQAGTIDLGAGSGGDSGTALIDVDGDLTLSGTITSNAPGRFGAETAALYGCQLRLTPTAVINSAGDFSVNRLTGRSSVRIESGAQVIADAIAGANEIIYRNAGDPPVLDGAISPAANVVQNPNLSPCPVCGDGQVTQTETCDDGNTVAGDGCNADCVDEACIAATPDYPIRALCDDGISCTTDSCTNGVCQGTSNCPAGGICNLSTSTCEAGGTTTTIPMGSTTTTLFSPSTSTTMIATTTTTMGGQAECGNGTLEGGEACDHGATNGITGDSCDGQCQLRTCGDPNGSGSITASDALFVLQSAVGAAACDVCLCDVVGGGSIVTASDALAVLRRSVGIQVPFTCPVCF